jgi:phosphoenolpyruvate carboxylase
MDYRQDLIRLDRAQEPYRRELRKLNSALEEQLDEFNKSLRTR